MFLLPWWDEFYNDYKDWCENRNQAPDNATSFKKIFLSEINKLYSDVQATKRMIDGKRLNIYSNITLRPNSVHCFEFKYQNIS